MSPTVPSIPKTVPSVTRTVRVTRVWDVPVLAEYGDTEDDLLIKASAGTVTAATEHKNLLPEGD